MAYRKKIFLAIILFIIFPTCSFAYSVDTNGMSSSVSSLIEQLESSWPSGLDKGRIEVVRQAGLMIDKGTKYVWGGGHSGTCITGKPDGLDCSGYVSLAFNRAGVKDVSCDWTTASYATSSNFENINESNLRPGDIGLNNETTSSSNHIGIFVGKKNGVNIWFHSSNYNGVSGPQVREGNGYFKVFKRYKKWNEVHVSSSSSNSNIGGALGGRLEDDYPNIDVINTSDDFNCETIFLTVSNGVAEETTLKQILNGIFGLMKIAAPIVAIIFSFIDYIKILFNVNSDSFRKANIRTIKRIALAILVFFVPNILELLFNFFGLYDLSNCGIS